MRERKNLKDQIIEKAKNPKFDLYPDLISTGCNVLDLALGGGFPLGQVVNLIGDTGSGKTLLSIECLINAIQLYGDKLKGKYDNAESRYSFNTDRIYGVSLDKNIFVHSPTVEDFNHNFLKHIRSINPDKGEMGIYIADSLNNMGSRAGQKRAEEEFKSMEKGKYYDQGTYAMEKQKYLSGDFFVNLSEQARKSNCLLIIISQVRDNIGVIYGKKLKSSGGRALRHQAYQIIWLSETEKHSNSKGKISGVSLKAFIEKNNVGSFSQHCYFEDIMYYGIDNVWSNTAYLFDLVTNTGKRVKTFNIEWDNQTFKDRKKFIKYIEENNQEELLKSKTIEKWNKEDEKADESKDRKKKYS